MIDGSKPLAYLFSVFMSDIFSNILSDMNAPDCDIATAECGNECHFSILREGVLACGDGIDGMHMYSEQVYYLH